MVQTASAGLNNTQKSAAVTPFHCRQRKTVYKHRELMAVIDQYRRQPAAIDLGPAGRETSIVAALRRRLAAKDDEIRELRATVAQQKISNRAGSTVNSILTLPRLATVQTRQQRLAAAGVCHDARVTGGGPLLERVACAKLDRDLRCDPCQPVGRGGDRCRA
jgi:hypothetical protein